MIDEFYDKLNSLNMDHIDNALNQIQKHHKQQRFYEVKYKIPSKWTKKFNLNDVIPYADKLLPSIVDEFGMVNDPLPKLRKSDLV